MFKGLLACTAHVGVWGEPAGHRAAGMWNCMAHAGLGWFSSWLGSPPQKLIVSLEVGPCWMKINQQIFFLSPVRHSPPATTPYC